MERCSRYRRHYPFATMSDRIGSGTASLAGLQRSYIESRVNTNVQAPSICGTFCSLRIPLPASRERGAIFTPSALDDKIDLNRRMNETLEAMARAIFKDWFIDFGPVRAKMEGRTPPGLAPEVAVLFPDSLDDEGKPTGGNSRDVYAFADVVYGAPFA